MASPFPVLYLALTLSFVPRVPGKLECTTTASRTSVDYVLVPSSPSDTVHLLMTDSAEEARITALCHVVCINYAFNPESGSGGNLASIGTPSAHNFTGSAVGEVKDALLDMNHGIFESNCSQLKKYSDCRTGCIAQSVGENNCVGTCSMRCEGICDSNAGCSGFGGNHCGIGCNREDCNKGCRLFSRLPSDALTQPVETPMLIRVKKQGYFFIVSIPSGLEMYVNPSLVFRIETRPGEYVYQWMVNVTFSLPNVTVMEYILDLSTFVGRTVNVSLAFATETGLSTYSEPTTKRLFSEIVPVSPSDISHALVTDSQEEAEYTALCHISCISYAFQDMLDTNSTDDNYTTTYTSVDVEFSEGILNFSCQQLRKYIDCRTGCIAQCMGQEVVERCPGRCQEICDVYPGVGCSAYDGNLCGAGCKIKDCNAGSQKCFLTKIQMPAPTTAPELMQVSKNIYSIVIPSEVDLYEYSSVVFRIETEMGGYYYQWMVDVVFELSDVSIIEYLLDLSAYTGQRLNIAYAFAANMDISEYSANSVVHVPDQCVVVELDTSQVGVTAERDDRVGFFAQYVLTVSWCLTQCNEGVAYYVITRNPDGGMCGETVNVTVNTSTSSVILRSSIRRNLNLPCTQTVQVQTVLQDGTTQEVERSKTLESIAGASNFPDIEIVGCPVTYDSQTEMYLVDFQFRTPFSAAALSHIRHFAIHVDSLQRLEQGPNDYTLVGRRMPIDDNIPASVKDTIYNYTTSLQPFGDFNHYYRIFVEIRWMQPNGPSKSEICLTIDTIVPPPLPIQNITIIDTTTVRIVQVGPDTQQITASVRVEWEMPELQYSKDISQYELFLGGRPLESTEAGSELNIIDGKSLNGSITRVFDGISLLNTTVTAFLQIRCRQYPSIPSNWSEAEEIIIDKHSSENSSSTLSSQATPPDVTLPVTLAVLSAVLLIAITAVIIWIYHSKQKSKNMKKRPNVKMFTHLRLNGVVTGRNLILDEWEIATDDIIADELLGKGEFGEVYKGVIRGPLKNPKISFVLRQAMAIPVAIKLLKPLSVDKEKADFLAEIDMMKRIAEGYNSHIVNMVGCVTLQEPLCLITEFVPYGDLLSYLKYQRKKCSHAQTREDQQTDTLPDGPELKDSPQPSIELDNAYSHLEPMKGDEDTYHHRELGDIKPNDLISFAYQITGGMEYLSSLKIVHRDLACRNVLVAKDKLLKITDFGLSRQVQEVYVKKTSGRLPLKWMAIESIKASEFTTASDVWAFGVTLYEIGTIGGLPYATINNEDLLSRLSEGYRLEKPDNCSTVVYDLMLRCWKENPTDRPSFSQLCASFSSMLQASAADKYIDLQVNEEAPYYQIRDKGERRDSASFDGSVSAGWLQERPAQLGIPISQLGPSSFSAAHDIELQLLTPAIPTPLESRKINPYVLEPSQEIDDNSLADSQLNGGII